MKRLQMKALSLQAGQRPLLGCLGWLLLMPFAGAAWLAMKAVDACIKKGLRPLGFVVCLLLGGSCIWLGHLLAYEGYVEWRGTEVHRITYPVAGWIGMVIGGSIVLGGALRSVAVSKEQVELEELTERPDKQRKEEEKRAAKKAAREILDRGVIDDYEALESVYRVLARDMYDVESGQLSESLRKLSKDQRRAARKQAKPRGG